MLTEELEEEKKRTIFWDYVGQTLWGIDSAIRGMLGVSSDIPQYIELAHPETKKQGPQTAEEVFEYVLNGLG